MSQQGSRARGGRRGPSRRPRIQREQAAPIEQRYMLVGGDADHAHVAVLEDGVLVEHYVGRSSKRSLAGNIYYGRVQNILPGMEAAFVDIGQARNAVLYVSEVSVNEDVEGTPIAPGSGQRIEQMLKSSQQVLVQVTKDPMGTKGARLTQQVSLAGRYVVLMPNSSGVNVSRRLDDAERDRLRSIARSFRPETFELIIRTAAEGATEDELRRDTNRLVRLWEEIERRAKSATAPAEIYIEPDLVIKVIRDLFSRDYDKLIVGDPVVYDKVRHYLEAVDPELLAKLEHHTGPVEIFDHFHVTEQLRKSLERKVWLPSGGNIVVDRAEALTVIDVNSARYSGRRGGNLEDTVLAVNLEAAEEVVRQLRLRDIGGIIIIDFIDMSIAGYREKVLQTLRKALAKDKTKTQVIGLSPLGLVEMTRKNVSEGVVEALTVPCPTCEGRGVIMADEQQV